MNDTVIAPEIVRELAGTRRWVRIATWVMLALIVLTIVNAVVLVVSTGQSAEVLGATLASNGLNLLVYVVLAVLLHKFANAVARAGDTGSATDVEAALDRQRRFWKVLGILTLIVVVLAAIGIVVGIIFVAGGMAGLFPMPTR